MASAGNNCVVCDGATTLHLRVAGAAGNQGLVPTTDRFGVALSDIVRCGSCGHMQLDRMPAEAELAEAYGEAESFDYVEEADGQRATARRILGEIERYAKPARLLDLGCWVGFALAEAGERGWRAQGVEPSEFASGYARDELGLDVVTAELLTADLPEQGYDAIFMGDVIEHLPDPGGALDRLGGLLVPGGILALALPDAGSRVARLMGRRWWSVIPTHVHYFTRESLARLLDAHGFTPLKVRTSPKAFTVRYYLSRIGGYSEPLGRGLVAAAEGIGVADRLWAPDFRDRMVMLAQRR